MFPMGFNGTIDKNSIINNNTYYTNAGTSMTHIINGMAGNIESHSTLAKGQSPLDYTCLLDDSHYGLSALTVHNETVLSWKFVKGSNGESGDEFTLIKRGSASGNGTCTTTKATETATRSATGVPATTTMGTVTGVITEDCSEMATGTATEVTTQAPTTILTNTDTTAVTVVEVVSSYTTYCPGATTFTQGTKTYTVTEVSVFTICWKENAITNYYSRLL